LNESTAPAQGGAVAAAATTLSFGYSAAEDRIVGMFRQGSAGASVLLTRRLVRQLIAQLARFLDQASPVARRAPAAMRAEVVQIEHHSAVAQLARSSDPAAAKEIRAADVRGPALLVTQVNLAPRGSGFLLQFGDAEGRAVKLRLQSADLHRLVGALRQQAQTAQWDLADAVPWLAQPEPPAGA
jgi:hypothetical protein